MTLKSIVVAKCIVTFPTIEKNPKKNSKNKFSLGNRAWTLCMRGRDDNLHHNSFKKDKIHGKH